MRIGLRSGSLAFVLMVVACERSPETITGNAPHPSMATATSTAAAKSPQATIGINVLLKGPATAAQLAELNTLGTVTDEIPQLNALLMAAKAGNLALIQALSYVAGANPDAERGDAPLDALAVSDFTGGLSTWDMDAINVTVSPFTSTRNTLGFTGDGVYVGILDTGLLDNWRSYFPADRIATQFAIAFQGGGGAMNKGAVPSQPNVWEHDQNSHGTHVTSTVIGYSFGGTPINGVAPKAKIIPVKVLKQSGFGWSSMIARGITYITDLKMAGQLGNHPAVINMSLGGPNLDVVEKAAIDRAVAHGVILVAAAGNSGTAGMGFPGAYPPVISVAAVGWTGQWVAHPFGSPPLAFCNSSRRWWLCGNVADPTNPNDFYIAPFSGRQKTGQDLDVAAPGAWTVGPYQLNSGSRLTYFFLSGTSMATPHVAGIVALMAQKDAALTAGDAETILEGSALGLGTGPVTITNPNGSTSAVSWGTDATGAGLVQAGAALAATP
jgi:subtilisin family serine protease